MDETIEDILNFRFIAFSYLLFFGPDSHQHLSISRSGFRQKNFRFFALR